MAEQDEQVVVLGKENNWFYVGISKERTNYLVFL